MVPQLLRTKSAVALIGIDDLLRKIEEILDVGSEARAVHQAPCNTDTLDHPAHVLRVVEIVQIDIDGGTSGSALRRLTRPRARGRCNPGDTATLGNRQIDSRNHCARSLSKKLKMYICMSLNSAEPLAV